MIRPGEPVVVGGLLDRLGVDDELPGARRGDGLGKGAEIQGIDHSDDADPGQRVLLTTHGDSANVVSQQLHHRVGVETGQLPRDHGDVHLAGGGAGQQVGQVDAPLEHVTGAAAEHAERRRLPRLAAGGQEHAHPVGHGFSPSWR